MFFDAEPWPKHLIDLPKNTNLMHYGSPDEGLKGILHCFHWQIFVLLQLAVRDHRTPLQGHEATRVIFAVVVWAAIYMALALIYPSGGRLHVLLHPLC